MTVFTQSAASLAREVKSRRLSAVELMQAHLARIEETHLQINAVVELLAPSALAAAQEADTELGKGNYTGPLMGIPFSIKDSIDLAGARTTAGTIGRRSAPEAERDATLVARLRSAGAIPIAKTNLPDLLFSYETDNYLFGRTNNPYDLSRTPGGSSGGEAALIATGGSALGLGSDALGSVRVPAAFCGIAAIKPTSGRLPRTGHVPPPGGWAESLWQIGPMARYVEDLILTMPLLAYSDVEDFCSPPAPLLDSPLDISALRVAFYVDNGFARCQPEIRAAVQSCALFLADEGAEVTEDRPPGVNDAFELEMALFGADGGEGIDNYMSSIGSRQIHPLHTNFVSRMRPHKANATQFAKRWAQWDGYRAGLAKFFQRYDIVLCPVYTQAALHHGDSMQEENFRGFSYTMAWNVGQTPAATVRCGAHNGLPINVQVVARPWNDMLTLRVCHAIEQRFGGYQKP